MGNQSSGRISREPSSNVSVGDGGVVVLGGLIRNDRTKTESKVPVLGDVPVLGMAFKQSVWRKNRSDWIVLIRPTVMRTPEAAQAEAQKLREDFKGLDNLPPDKVPPVPAEPERPTNQPRPRPIPPTKGSYAATKPAGARRL
jgi:general secretion pathway protein D